MTRFSGLGSAHACVFVHVSYMLKPCRTGCLIRKKLSGSLQDGWWPDLEVPVRSVHNFSKACMGAATDVKKQSSFPHSAFYPLILFSPVSEQS